MPTRRAAASRARAICGRQATRGRAAARTAHRAAATPAAHASAQRCAREGARQLPRRMPRHMPLAWRHVVVSREARVVLAAAARAVARGPRAARLDACEHAVVPRRPLGLVLCRGEPHGAGALGGRGVPLHPHRDAAEAEVCTVRWWQVRRGRRREVDGRRDRWRGKAEVHLPRRSRFEGVSDAPSARRPYRLRRTRRLGGRNSTHPRLLVQIPRHAAARCPPPHRRAELDER